MRVKVGDKVLVIAGSSKGKEGKVLRTFKNENKVVVEGVNLHKKHLKPNGAGENGGIVEREAKIDASNVKVISAVNKKEESKKTVKKEEVKTKAEPKKKEKKESPKKTK